jgi:predicted flap endonuclease-1-like 5' DNA nuclease
LGSLWAQDAAGADSTKKAKKEENAKQAVKAEKAASEQIKTAAKESASAEPAKPDATGAASKAPRVRRDPMDDLFRILQVGRTHEGVEVPFSKDGVLSTYLTSATMTRLDPENIQFVDAKIDQISDKMLMTIPRGVYHKTLDQLHSEVPCTVESPDYRMEGDKLMVDRKSNIYCMEGRVRFMYFGAKSLLSDPGKPAPASSPAPAASSAPTAPPK